ncbi:MAG: hypothetical protein J2P57_01450 [Acidimicrobiaceae bacterium]|nr:hypothetical protein [Acidimicrobiaceae bacterium]
MPYWPGASAVGKVAAGGFGLAHGGVALSGGGGGTDGAAFAEAAVPT